MKERKQVVCLVKDANGNVIKSFLVKEGWDRLDELKKRVEKTGCYLDTLSSRGNESQLVQLVTELEKEYIELWGE